jgi:hypothetical protein
MHFHLGKIFISHTTAHKPFVRRLAARLEESHFHTWLDEQDLIAGDPLPQSIGKALQAAKVILGIISKASVASNWLRDELNLATEVVVGAAPASIEGEIRKSLATNGMRFMTLSRIQTELARENGAVG